MKRHAGSKQKPVPNLPSMAGPRNFNSVCGTTVLLKSCGCTTVEGTAHGSGLGKTSWAGACGDRHEHTIKSGTTVRKIIRHHRDSGRVSSDVLHALLHRVSAEHKGFSETDRKSVV